MDQVQAKGGFSSDGLLHTILPEAHILKTNCVDVINRMLPILIATRRVV